MAGRSPPDALLAIMQTLIDGYNIISVSSIDIDVPIIWLSLQLITFTQIYIRSSTLEEKQPSLMDMPVLIEKYPSLWSWNKIDVREVNVDIPPFV